MTMSEAKPTPGPWSIEENVRAGGVIHLAVTNRAAGDDWMPCSITPMAWVRDIDYANARLIAAAPELLEAAKKAARHMGDDQRDDLIAAIAKAEGSES